MAEQRARPHGPGAEPSTLVLCGASGDLARRKLLPALFGLRRSGAAAGGLRILGFARDPYSPEAYREVADAALAASGAPGADDARARADFAACIDYVTGDFTDPGAYAEIASRISAAGMPAHRLFYLATPPPFYPPIVDHLGRAGLARAAGPPGAAGEGSTAIVIEKPFGTDLLSAQALNRRVHRYFREEQVFRIDHYLGKETVQNIIVLRFANGLFEPVWNRTYVDHVQITVAETLGVEGRGAYYEGAGALRDMLQNHLLQLLTLVAMEPPVAFRADDVRDRKVDVLRSIHPLAPEAVAASVVRGQYTAGALPEEPGRRRRGAPLPGYREEHGVAPDSATETFVAARVLIDNWRWGGVPFYLRTGKRLQHRAAEIAIEFKRPPQTLFLDTGAGRRGLQPNVLVVRIEPEEGVFVRFGAKAPGEGIDVVPVEMDFAYQGSFPNSGQGGYGRLLLDALRRDATLFARADEAEAAWRLVDSIRAGWQVQDAGPPQAAPALQPYAAGSWGPPGAGRLMARAGRAWRRP